MPNYLDYLFQGLKPVGPQPWMPTPPAFGQQGPAPGTPPVVPGGPAGVPASPAAPATPVPAAATAPVGFRPWDDPMTMLTLGAGLLQPIQPGGTAGGVAGQALVNAMQAYVGGQERSRRAGLQEREVTSSERRTGAIEREEKRREKDSAVNRRRLEQQISQNEKLFPETLRRLNAEIDRGVAAGSLDEARAELLRQEARENPQKIQAQINLMNAQAAAAGKPGTADIFNATVQSIAASEDISPDEARARLGGSYFGRGGRSSGGGTLQEITKMVRAANPQRPEEDSQAYNQRINQIALDQHKSAVRKDYTTQLSDFLKSSAADVTRFRTIDEAVQFFNDKIWKAGGRELPDEAQGAVAPPPPAPQDPAQREKGKTYQTPKGLMEWTGTGWRPVHGAGTIRR